MTDRELAGCAQVRRYYHSPDGFSAMELDSDGEYVLHSDYAALLARAEAAERDAARYRWLRENDNANMLAEDVIDDAIAAAEGENHG